ncbi:MAG TPA: outer membrane protein transport protein [Bacteroidia bacterium]|nr:outer membrane protein transport protein [Bacteroidia bacterium]
MKKNLIYLLILLAALAFSSIAEAQIDNLTNLSPEWIRSGARNAATDGTDILAYNPGGVTRLKSGFHINIGNQSFMRKPSHEFDLGYGKTKYEQDGNDLFVPNLYLSYNKNNWALFGGFYIAGGGASANYPTGSISTDMVSFGSLAATGGAYQSYTNAYLKASSYYMAGAIGGAYKVSEMLSFGLSVRNIMAKNTTEAGTTLIDMTGQMPDYSMSLNNEDKASGMGIVAGVNIMPSQSLNLAFRYESRVKLDFKTKQIKTDDFGLTVDGDENRRDLPAVAGFGIAYSVNDKFKILSDFNYYFQKQADWGTTFIGEEVELSALAGDAYTYSLSFEYKILPKITFSLGGVYTRDHYKDREGYYTHLGAFEVVQENNFSVNTGFALALTEKIKVNLGYLRAIYAKDKTVTAIAIPTDVKINNNISAFGIGVDLTF